MCLSNTWKKFVIYGERVSQIGGLRYTIWMLNNQYFLEGKWIQISMLQLPVIEDFWEREGEFRLGSRRTFDEEFTRWVSRVFLFCNRKLFRSGRRNKQFRIVFTLTEDTSSTPTLRKCTFHRLTRKEHRLLSLRVIGFGYLQLAGKRDGILQGRQDGRGGYVEELSRLPHGHLRLWNLPGTSKGRSSSLGVSDASWRGLRKLVETRRDYVKFN